MVFRLYVLVSDLPTLCGLKFFSLIASPDEIMTYKFKRYSQEGLFPINAKLRTMFDFTVFALFLSFKSTYRTRL